MTENDAEFDYIVVGGGSAGAVVAHRLSARPNLRVLLLEAGRSDRALHAPSQFLDNMLIQIPAGFVRVSTAPKVNWNYVANLGPVAADRVVPFPRGKVLGGCSSTNGLLYVRGQSEDYDDWAAAGCSGWGWDDVLPYFKRAEDQARGADAVHGVGGPVRIEDVASHPVSGAFMDACAAAGLARVDDVNGGRQEGVTRVQATVRRGRRQSTAAAYLHPVSRRRNLEIVTDAVATRILLSDGRATGVLYRFRGSERTVRARREVIVCGGVVNSPRLLQLSGLGPSDVLKAAGVAVRKDLPGIGSNLQDHYAIMMRFRLRPGVKSANQAARGGRLIREVADYVVRRRGLLTSPPTDVVGFLRSEPWLRRPDIQLHAVAASADPERGTLDPFPGMTIAPCQLRPESRGSVRIGSPDPEDSPPIFLNALAADVDKMAVVRGMRFVRRIVAQSPLAEIVEAEVGPGPGVASDAAMLEHAARCGGSIYHGVGTCAMGTGEGAVVDPALRVHGVRSLRVADASIMPRIVSGNTNAAAIMIGEKASDLILADA